MTALMMAQNLGSEDLASSSSLLLSSLELSDATIYEPQIRALLETAPHFCQAVVLEFRTVPLGTALNLRIIRVSRRVVGLGLRVWERPRP